MDARTKNEPTVRSNSQVAKARRDSQPVSVPPLLPSAPKLMLVFWMLLGCVAGISLAQSVWRMTGLRTGIFAIALPVGAIAGAVGGVLVGRITHPHLLVLVMALLAGWSVGSLGGGLIWAETGQIVGGFIGALGGGLTWVVWLLLGRGEKAP